MSKFEGKVFSRRFIISSRQPRSLRTRKPLPKFDKQISAASARVEGSKVVDNSNGCLREKGEKLFLFAGN